MVNASGEAANGWLGQKLLHIANESAELPVVSLLGKPLYRHMFRRPFRPDNSYYGVYDSYAEAMAHAPATMPNHFADADAAGLYREKHEAIRVSDYPVLYWTRQLIDEGCRRFFDLGGHKGLTYYGFRHYIDYPDGLQWTVHDVPDIMQAGRQLAQTNDPDGRLQFSGSRHDASGHEVLFTSGALQFFDYTLPELLSELAAPPQHVLINMVPMHPRRGFFTLQNMGKAILPYRVAAIPEFIAAMEAQGYTKRDQWHSQERSLRVPFEPEINIDGYEGFYFRKTGPA